MGSAGATRNSAGFVTMTSSGSRSANRYPCPCCGYLTLDQPASGTYDICPVCFWEDDAVQNEDPDFDGGANKPSLNQARANFARFGAVEQRLTQHVRPPLPDELPPR